VSEQTRRTPECLDAESLAALIDGRTDAATRDRAEAHIDKCVDCHEAWVEALALLKEVQDERPRSRAGWWIGATLLAASIAALAWVVPLIRSQRPGAEANEALATFIAETGSVRAQLGRLSQSGEWRSWAGPTRSAAQPSTTVEQDEILSRLRRLATEHGDAETLRAYGVAQVLAGALDAGVNDLAAAVELAPDDPAGRVDYAAGLLEKARHAGDQFSATQALDQARRALELSPGSQPALFNRALSLEALGMTDAAIRAWEDFLAVEGAGGWASEARERLAALRKKSPPALNPGGLPADLGDDALRDLATTHAEVAQSFLADRLLKWAEAFDRGEPASLEFEARVAAALVSAGADRARVDLLRVASDTRTASRPGPIAVARAVRALERSEASRRSGDTAGAVDAADDAGRQLAAAGLPPTLADLARYTANLASGVRPDSATSRRILAEADSHGYSTVASEVLRLEGLMAVQQARLGEASELYERALGRALGARDAARAALFEQLIAEILDEQGDRSGAWSRLGSAFGRLVPAAAPREWCEAVATAAIAAAHAGLAGAALEFSNELFRSALNDNDRIVSLLQRARARASLGSHERAMPDLDAARSIVASMPNERMRRAWDAEVGWIEGLVYSRSDPSKALPAVSRAVQYFDDARQPFRLAELLLLRGRLHRAVGSSPDAIADWRRGAQLLEDQRPHLRSEQLRISRTDQAWDLFGEIIDATTDHVAALAVAERARSRELLASLSPGSEQRAWPVDRLQAVLPADAIALVYAVRPQRLVIWIVTRAGVRFVERETPAAHLARLVDQQRAEIVRGASPVASAQLRDLLVPAGLPLSPDKPLILVPDGPLHRVAFGSLVRNPGHVYLVSESMPVIAPSLTTLALASERLNTSTRASALIAAVDIALADVGLPALPSVAEETSALVRLYPGTPPLLNQQVSLDSLRARLPEASIVHFSGHARADSARPDRSGLYLPSKDGTTILSAGALASLQLRPGATVVLGACDTGAGPLSRGEGALTLARPFLAAGAGAVIAALWEVRDRSSAAFLVAVHERLRRGASAHAALAETQRDWIESGRSSSEWAPFLVTGGVAMKE